MTFVQERQKQLIIIIFVAALAVRLGALILLQDNDEIFRHDTFGSTPQHIALGEGFSSGYDASGAPRPSAEHAPGYVYLIGLVYYLFGIQSVQSIVVIQLIQSLIAACTCLTLYHLGKKIFHVEAGLLSALILAFYPPSIYFSIISVNFESSAVLLLTLIMIYLLKIQETLRYRDAIICGVLMGLTAYLLPIAILFYVLSCIWLLFWSSHFRFGAVKCSLIMGLVCIICLLPWTIRNYTVFNTFVPIKSTMGHNLLEGNHPDSNGVERIRAPEKVFSPEELSILEQLDEVQRENFMLQRAKSIIKANSQRFIKLSLRRFFYYWSPMNPYLVNRFSTLRTLTYGPVFFLAILGVIITRKRWKYVSLPLLFFLSYPLMFYVTTIHFNRYRYPVEPFLILFASYALVEVIARFRRSRSLRLVEQT